MNWKSYMKVFARVVVIVIASLLAGWAVGSEWLNGSTNARGSEVPEHQHVPPPPASTLRTVLRHYAPSRIAELEAAAIAEGRALDEPVGAELPAWESISDEVLEALVVPEQADRRFARHLDWGHEQLTEDVDFRQPLYNPSGAELSAEDLASVRRVAERLDDELMRLVEMESIELEAALRHLWTMEGRVERIPFVLVPSVQSSAKGYSTRSIHYKNWTVTVEIREGDWPPYDQALRAIVRARAQRLLAVQSHVQQLLTAED